MSFNNHMSADRDDFKAVLDLMRSECKAGKTAWGEFYILAAFVNVLLEAERGAKPATILARYHAELDGSLGIAPEEL